MEIYGLQKTTLLDYPGKIASTIFTPGCNFRCPFCHNPELVNFKKYFQVRIPEKKVLDFFKRRQGVLDGVCITGGEPTLQPDLPEFIQKLKNLGYAVKLDTNGNRPEIIKKVLEAKLLDYIAMDIKSSLVKYLKIAGPGYEKDKVLESIRILLTESPDYQFRTTVVPGIHDLEEINRIGQIINGAKLYVLQNFINDKTLDPNFKKRASFTPSQMADFAEAIRPYVKKIEVRH